MRSTAAPCTTLPRLVSLVGAALEEGEFSTGKSSNALNRLREEGDMGNLYLVINVWGSAGSLVPGHLQHHLDQVGIFLGGA